MRGPVTLTRPDMTTTAMRVRVADHPHGGGDYAVITEHLELGGTWATITSREADNPADASLDFDDVLADAVAAGWVAGD